MNFLRHHHGVEAICDPASQQLSMSRFLLAIIVLVYWPFNVICDVVLKLAHAGKMENWLALGTMTGAIAGIYWFNSTAGTWGRSGQPVVGSWEKKGEAACINPNPPKAKPAPTQEVG